jgi:hypothetical protein
VAVVVVVMELARTLAAMEALVVAVLVTLEAALVETPTGLTEHTVTMVELVLLAEMPLEVEAEALAQ